MDKRNGGEGEGEEGENKGRREVDQHQIPSLWPFVMASTPVGALTKAARPAFMSGKC